MKLHGGPAAYRHKWHDTGDAWKMRYGNVKPVPAWIRILEGIVLMLSIVLFVAVVAAAVMAVK